MRAGSPPDEHAAPSDTGLAAELQRTRDQLREAQARLLEAEASLARLPELEHESARRRTADAAVLEGLRRQLAEVTNSRSWRVTRPLRSVKAVVRRRQAS